MRFVVTGSFLLVAFAVLATAEEWSWSKDKTKDQTTPTAASGAADRESKSIDSYSDVNDNDSQEGGASVASLSGNETDTHPRHIIRDRLCGLGLMEVTIINFIADTPLYTVMLPHAHRVGVCAEGGTDRDACNTILLPDKPSHSFDGSRNCPRHKIL